MDPIAFEVPPINRRERIPAAAIEDVVSQISDRFNPQKIILFGSYAYGQPHPDSDVDLLVIMDTSLSGVQQSIKILQAVQYRFGIDLLVYTPTFLEQRLAIGDPFVNEIINNGKVVYESAGV